MLMRPDPGRDVLERIHAGMTSAQRARIGQRLREDGFRHVWNQVDRADLMGPVEEGMFILGRLYPEMPTEHRESFRRQMQAAHERGQWNGFRRPPDHPTD
jgi:hypothetical protein